MRRRDMMKITALTAIGATLPVQAAFDGEMMVDDKKYGIIGQMKVAAGKRDELIAILASGTRDMPGNLSYVISEDQSDENAIWITEYWESKEAHAASLQLPSVQDAIGKGRAMIEGFGHRFEVTPRAGK